MNLLNLLRHISQKHVRFQKARTIMAASGICLGVAAVVSIGIVNKSVLRSFEESINDATGRASLQITGPASGFPEAFLDTVRDVQGVEYAVPVIEAQGILVGAREPALMILGVDVLLDHQIRDYKLTDESADIPDPLMFLARADSLLLTKRAADREGIALEQTVRVQTVQGILPFRVRGLLNPEGPARAMGGNVAVMDLFAAQKVFGKEGRLDRIDVSLARGADLDRVKSGIESAIPAGYRVDTPEGRTKQVEVLLATFQKNINLTSFITMFVGMYLIYNAVSISVVQRRREIGILRAIGTTRREIVRLLLGETLVTALAASAFGVGFGVLLAKAAIGAIGKIVSEMYLQTSVTEITLSWTHPALGIAIGVAASLVAAFLPALSSTRISPISAIRSVPYSEKGIISGGMLRIASGSCLILAAVLLALYKTSEPTAVLHSTPLMFGAILLVLLGISLATPDVLRWFLAFFRRAVARRLGSTGMLAGLNLQKNVTRNSVAAAAIFYGIAIFVSTSGFMESARVSVIDFIDSVTRADILVTSGHPLATSGSQNIPMPVEMEQEIARVPGVLSADPYRKIYIDYGGRRVQLETVDVARRVAYSPFMFAAGTRSDVLRLMPDQDTVLVNEGFAARFGLKPGDVVTLPTSAGPVRFGVAAVFVDFGSDSGIVLVDIHTYQRHWGEYLADMFSVRVKQGHDVAAVQRAIADSLGKNRSLYILPAREFKEEVRKVVDRMFIVDHAISIITLSIASLGIIITLLSSVLERTREIGVLRSIGMVRSQVSRIVILEAMLLGLVGGALGSVAGIALGWMSLDGFLRADYGASIRYYLPWTYIIWALILSAGLSALAGAYPARRAANTNIVEALAYE